VEAWVLFAISFSLAIPTLPGDSLDVSGRLTRAGSDAAGSEPMARHRTQIVLTPFALPVSLLPTLLGTAAKFICGRNVLDWRSCTSSAAAFSKSRQAARQLLLASVIYLPLLFI